MPDSIIPVWLEGLRLPDAVLDEAYESSPARYRAALKTGIALAHFYFGDLPWEQERQIIHRRLGFFSRCGSSADDWTIIVIDGTIKGAAAICAAIILPVLAGVERIAVFCIGQPNGMAIPLALSMCGIADIFCMEERQCLNALAHFARVSPRGHAAFLHGGRLRNLEAAARKSFSSIIPLYFEPKLLILDRNGFDPDCLEFCAGIMPESDPARSACWDAVFCASLEQAAGIPARMALLPDCEGFWLFESVAPGFFRSGCLGFGFLDQTDIQ